MGIGNTRAMALAADAEDVVSGDRDLLDLSSYGAVDIVSPSEFVELVA